MNGPSIPVRTYVLNWVALMLFALATTLIGFIDLGPFSMVIAVTIATIKAALIVYFFMQAKRESLVVHIVIAGGVIWFLILVSNTLGDYITRGWLPVPGK